MNNYNAMEKKVYVVKLFCTILCCVAFVLITTAVFAQTPFDEGLKEFRAENYEEALQFFKDAHQLEPSSTSVSFYLGLTCKLMENNREAVPHLRNAVTNTPRIREALIELIDTLYQTDQLEEAKKWIEIGEKEDVTPGRIQFLKGLVLSKEGKNVEAVAAFEKAKTFDGSLSQVVEFQIANAYLKEGKLKESQRRFKSAITLDPHSDIGTYAKDYENLVSDKMDRERPFRFAVGLSYKYDSNVNASPTSGPLVDIPALAANFTGQEDTGLNTTIRVMYIAPFSFRTPYSFSAQYSLYADRYFRRDDYNMMQQSLMFTPGYNFPKFSISMPVMFAYTWLQGDSRGEGMGTDFLNNPVNWLKNSRYMKMMGFNPTLRFMIGQNGLGEVSIGYTDKKYDAWPNADAVSPTTEEDRDGVNTSFSLGYTHFFKEGLGLASLRYTLADEEAKGRNWTFLENKFSMSFIYPFTKLFKAQVAAEAAFADYKYLNTVFNLDAAGQPAMKRRDEIYSATFALSYTVFKNTDIIGQYNYIRDKSNIGSYDYKREIISLGFEYRY